ncbi:zinc finger protein-like [Tropilaelaps mercedesae]|uniref:Zinc finger protein-like n=1 Tax=Tropilaelaps mercedesae TaxID=418985 RepID=A0A1V9Y1B2_9ACAR|nr:zinc finger protein-like [Tropilaelaps mercedesae]
MSASPIAVSLSHLSPPRLDTSGSLMAMTSLFANGDAASPITAGDLLLFNQQLDVVNRNLPSGSASALSSQTPQLDQRDPMTGRYVCKYCTYSTVQRTHLARHERSHTGERPFKCQFCPYSATLKTCLINHERTHTGEKPYKCKFCSYCASQKVTLERHQKTHFKSPQLSILDASNTLQPIDFSPENPSPPNA